MVPSSVQWESATRLNLGFRLGLMHRSGSDGFDGQCYMFSIQPFSQKSITPTVSKEFQFQARACNTLAFRALARSATHRLWARRPAPWPRARTGARTATLPRWGGRGAGKGCRRRHRSGGRRRGTVPTGAASLPTSAEGCPRGRIGLEAVEGVRREHIAHGHLLRIVGREVVVPPITARAAVLHGMRCFVNQFHPWGWGR